MSKPLWRHLHLMSSPDFTRCPAPTHTPGGTLRCITTRTRCDDPHHRAYDRTRYLAALVWAVKPWWPNRLGRAQDNGDAHTPNVSPCSHCTKEIR